MRNLTPYAQLRNLRHLPRGFHPVSTKQDYYHQEALLSIVAYDTKGGAPTPLGVEIGGSMSRAGQGVYHRCPRHIFRGSGRTSEPRKYFPFCTLAARLSSRSQVSRYAGKCFQCLTEPAVECRFEGDSQSKLDRLKALISKWSKGTWVTKDSESFNIGIEAPRYGFQMTGSGGLS